MTLSVIYTGLWYRQNLCNILEEREMGFEDQTLECHIASLHVIMFPCCIPVIYLLHFLSLQRVHIISSHIQCI